MGSQVQKVAASLLTGVLLTANVPEVEAAGRYAVGRCQVAQKDLPEDLSPINVARSYLYNYQRNSEKFKSFDLSEFGKNAKVTLLNQPKLGTIENTDLGWQYQPTTFNEDGTRVGRDYFVMKVENKGITVYVHYYIEVIGDDPTTYIGDDGERHDHFCKRETWKINAITPGNVNLAALLSGVGQNLTFANLASSAVGETLGTGSSAQITLDDNAAGHGWYIDTTPTLNEEYLPTSNPNEWIAKPGSEAEGKMDLLTVLQHEYLHTASFDHSPEPGNIMSATLQPGMRRTLTVDQQLALMRLAGYFPVPDSNPNSPYAPRDPGAPLPYTRSSATGTPARRRVVDTLGLGLNGKQAAPQFDTAANPTLTNPAFTGNTGWSTTGPIAFTNNAATLTESATAQTRLNQVFVVGPNDRFLSFTLANIGLDNPSTSSGQVKATAPDDAFEVALLDANTGASLLAGTGLTKSDAILNLQANGTERKASSLTSVLNPDGSRTYLVDLSGIAAGTVANLSFDLIGFGRGAAATSSHVTVRDLHLGLPLDARNDTAATAEDTPVDINPLSNDPGADPRAVLPVIKQTPAHGTVEVTLDGKLRYVPNPNWFGEDSFTYQLTDGALASGVVTVRVTVSPVNDAPTLADQSLTRPQNQPITGNLRR